MWYDVRLIFLVTPLVRKFEDACVKAFKIKIVPRDEHTETMCQFKRDNTL